MSNVIDLVDQTVFVGERATGAISLLQCVWIYDRPVDIDGLRRFRHHLQRGRLSRRIEQSPLPFGRHHWVSPGDSSDMEIAETPRPREEFDAWLSEQANTPLDYEHGPNWHLAVLPFTDGGTGVSLVVSHGLTDGVGLCQALADAAVGCDDPISWPPAASRRRSRAMYEDARQTARDTPAIGRAVVAAARMARRVRRDAGAATPAPKPIGAPDEQVVLPVATVCIDVRDWDDCAQARGGTSNSLLAGFAAKFAQRAGRVVAGDGSATLKIPVNQRSDGDTRANAVGDIDVTVDPIKATSDLREIRADVKQALIRLRDAADERFALLPLIPLLPQRLIRRMVGVAAGSPTSVCSSNLGDVDAAANRPDGTDADYFSMRSLYPGVTRATMHRAGGVLAFLSGRINGRIFISALTYEPGGTNSYSQLQQRLSDTLADFSLTGTLLWGCPEPVGR